MTARDKAARILSKLVFMHRPMIRLEVEDVQYGCTERELNFYYFWICCGGKGAVVQLTAQDKEQGGALNEKAR